MWFVEERRVEIRIEGSIWIEGWVITGERKAGNDETVEWRGKVYEGENRMNIVVAKHGLGIGLWYNGRGYKDKMDCYLWVLFTYGYCFSMCSSI